MSDVANRREFLKTSSSAVALASLAGAALAAKPAAAADPLPSGGANRGKIFKALKFGMARVPGDLAEKFKIIKDCGFDGVEFSSPGNFDVQAALDASAKVGLPIHGVVNSTHWSVRLSDPDATVRAKGLESLLTSIRDSHALGGSSVLLVPGRVSNPKTENQQQVWDRSLAQIQQALPLAAKLGVRILIENVWNGFCYIHNGPSDQTADKLAEYLDAANSPWVGSYFDIGNHQKYGKPADWIRTLGRRIVKLDVKDWGKEGGFGKIGDGDVDWGEVRAALAEINYRGWATAEVAGGDAKRLADIAARMNRALDI